MAAIELTKDWRTDRVLRRLEAMLAVADKDASLIITGNGDVLEPEHGIIAIGSGGAYAQAAARALLDHTELGAQDIVKKALEISHRAYVMRIGALDFEGPSHEILTSGRLESAYLG